MPLLNCSSLQETGALSPPNLRQDPLVLQLRDEPGSFQEDFLELPPKKQDTLLKVLRSNGVSRFDVNKLTPPGYKQNPFLRILQQNKLDTLENNNLTPPPFIKNVMEHPEEFKKEFRALSEETKVEVLEMIDVFDTGAFKVEKLVPNKSERLRIAPQHTRDPLADVSSSAQPDSFEALLNSGNSGVNPLQQFVEAKEDKNGKGAQYQKDPLLRQLRLNPESYQADFLKLPQRNQDSLLRILRGDEGLEAKLVERLVPPGQRQDPLLRALIAGDTGSDADLKPPGAHGNPLLRLLRPTGRDQKYRDNLNPPNYSQDPLLRQLRLNPKRYQDDFLNLPQEDQNELVEIITNMGDGRFPFEELIPQKSGRLIISPLHERDPLSQSLPDFPQKDNFAGDSPSTMQQQIFGEGKDPNDALTPPRYKQNPLLRQLLTEPKVYKDAFLDLPKKEQDTLLKILKKEGGEDFDIAILTLPKEEKDTSEANMEASKALDNNGKTV